MLTMTRIGTFIVQIAISSFIIATTTRHEYLFVAIKRGVRLSTSLSLYHHHHHPVTVRPLSSRRGPLKQSPATPEMERSCRKSVFAKGSAIPQQGGCDYDLLLLLLLFIQNDCEKKRA
jgi:hypothetical protein